MQLNVLQIRHFGAANLHQCGFRSASDLRRPSLKFHNKIAGTLHIHQFSLVAASTVAIRR